MKCVVSGCKQQASRSIKQINVCREHSRKIQAHINPDKVYSVTGLAKPKD
jgi:hypothetical protein